MTETTRRPQLDVRVGSSTDALAPVSVAKRSLGAGVWQWVGLVAVALAALGADQLTKSIVSDHLSLDEGSTSRGRSRSTTCRTRASRSGSSRARRLR